MVPNNVVLASAVVPLREPASVDLRARLRPDVMPSTVQELLDGRDPHAGPRPSRTIGLEEIDAEVVVRDRGDPCGRRGRTAARRRDPRVAIAPVTREGGES